MIARFHVRLYVIRQLRRVQRVNRDTGYRLSRQWSHFFRNYTFPFDDKIPISSRPSVSTSGTPDIGYRSWHWQLLSLAISERDGILSNASRRWVSLCKDSWFNENTLESSRCGKEKTKSSVWRRFPPPSSPSRKRGTRKWGTSGKETPTILKIILEVSSFPLPRCRNNVNWAQKVERGFCIFFAHELLLPRRRNWNVSSHELRSLLDYSRGYLFTPPRINTIRTSVVRAILWRFTFDIVLGFLRFHIDRRATWNIRCQTRNYVIRTGAGNFFSVSSKSKWFGSLAVVAPVRSLREKWKDQQCFRYAARLTCIASLKFCTSYYTTYLSVHLLDVELHNFVEKMPGAWQKARFHITRRIYDRLGRGRLVLCSDRCINVRRN